MEAIIHHTGGVKFEAQCRGHRVLSDQPAANGGEDAGMSPPELLLASLGTCAGFYALQYLRARNLPVEGLKVRVVAEKALGPSRLGSFRVEVALPQIEARHRDGALRAVRACLVHNTLVHGPRVETVLTAASSG